MKCALLFAFLCAASPALAASSDWYDTQGGRVRIVTTGLPDAAGVLRGALEIELKPGWKTYWRDPGDAGVPPQLIAETSRNVAAASFDFPAPQRHDDGGNLWAGYDYSVALPLRLTLADPADATLEASIFLGVCEAICVPVSAMFVLDAGAAADDPADLSLVEAAEAALPGPEQPDFGVTITHASPETVTVEAAFPGDAAAVDFFLAGENGYSFAAPEKTVADGRVTFSVDILNRPDAKPADGALHYTLVTDAGAVSGLLPYP